MVWDIYGFGRAGEEDYDISQESTEGRVQWQELGDYPKTCFFSQEI